MECPSCFKFTVKSTGQCTLKSSFLRTHDHLQLLHDVSMIRTVNNVSGNENALKVLYIQCILSFLYLVVNRFLDLILQAYL